MIIMAQQPYVNNYFRGMPNEYFSALNQESYVPLSPEYTEKGIIGMKDVGITAPPFQDQVESLKKRIFQGASKVELGFMGAGKGSMQGGNTTPGMYGKPHREAIREMARLNKVALSTHATTRTGSLAGITERGYSDEARAFALEEINRAIDFAADVQEGGPIVVHLGEYVRPIAGKFKEFERFEDEEKNSIVQFIDRNTGQVQQMRKDEKTYWPEMEIDEKTGMFKRDKWGSFIPKYDEKTGQYNVKPLTDEDAGRIQKYWKSEYNKDITVEQAKLFAKLEAQKRNAEAWAQQHSQRVGSELKDLEMLKKLKEDMVERWDSLDDYQKERWKQHVIQVAPREASELSQSERHSMDALQVIDRQIQGKESSLKYNRDVSSRYQEEAANIRDQIGDKENDPRIMPIEGYALKKTAQTIAEAGMFAMRKTKQNHLKKPLFISPENIFPESYGGHPDELREVIHESRKAMEKMLVRTGQAPNDEAAKKLAQEHIKATFDIAHANVWRKYYKGDPKNFDKWLIGKVEELAKEGLIGHLHVVDNLGYNDEHLAPGEGNTPIKEFVSKMKEYGVTDVIVEPSHNDFEVLKAGWREIAGSAISSFEVANDRWVNVENSYFGRVSSPYFLYGDMTPNPEGYRIYSGVRWE